MVDLTSLPDLEETPHATVFDGPDPRAIRLRLSAGERIPEHDHPDSVIVFHLLEGRMELALDGDACDLAAGDVARFDGDRAIAPRAVEDSTALLVFAPKGGSADGR